MGAVRRFLGIYRAFFSQQVKALVEYKADFALGMISLAFQQLSSFLLIFAVFTQIKAIGSYSFDQMLLFYGYSQVIRGVDHIWNDNIWQVGWAFVRNGRFSQYLIRPMRVLPQVVMERVQFDGLGELVLGLAVFLYAKARLGLAFGPAGWMAFAFFFLSGQAIYFAIKVACSAVAFWTVSSGELMTTVYEVNTFTKYPLDIYKSAVIRNILVYALPFAVVSYLPMAYFIKDAKFISNLLGLPLGGGAWILAFTAAVTAGSLLLAALVWNLGLRRYNATGT